MIDRAEVRRKDDAWLSGVWERPDAFCVGVVGPGRIAMADRAVADVPRSGSFDAERHVFLGTLEDRPVFAQLLDNDALGKATAAPLRGLVATLPPVWADIAVAATAIWQWHHLDRFCPGCGGETRVTHGGFARRCRRCERLIFPRTDAAVIVAVLDADDRLLLGHQRTWPEGRVSVLAGFVEAGESLEQAVHREIGEEVGVPLTAVDYMGSQPWPFPRSLMVGFWARAADTRIEVDGVEIVDAGWFTREQVAAALEGAAVPLQGHPITLPGPGTIARRLIDTWLG